VAVALQGVLRPPLSPGGPFVLGGGRVPGGRQGAPCGRAGPGTAGAGVGAAAMRHPRFFPGGPMTTPSPDASTSTRLRRRVTIAFLMSSAAAVAAALALVREGMHVAERTRKEAEARCLMMLQRVIEAERQKAERREERRLRRMLEDGGLRWLPSGPGRPVGGRDARR